jgi:hypothetical protein
VLRMNSPNLDREEENGGIGHAEEVSINQVFRKMTEILKSITEKKRPKGEDEALECFLKFQPPLFMGEVEQDQKAEVWLENLEDIF